MKLMFNSKTYALLAVLAVAPLYAADKDKNAAVPAVVAPAVAAPATPAGDVPKNAEAPKAASTESMLTKAFALPKNAFNGVKNGVVSTPAQVKAQWEILLDYIKTGKNEQSLIAQSGRAASIVLAVYLGCKGLEMIKSAVSAAFVDEEAEQRQAMRKKRQNDRRASDCCLE